MSPGESGFPPRETGVGSKCCRPPLGTTQTHDRWAPHTGHSLPRQPPPRAIIRGPADRRPRAAGTDHHNNTEALAGTHNVLSWDVGCRQRIKRPPTGTRPLLWAGERTRGQLEGATIHELAGVLRKTDRAATPVYTHDDRIDTRAYYSLLRTHTAQSFTPSHRVYESR